MTVFTIIFYRQNIRDSYSQQFLTFFEDWDMGVQKTMEQQERLTVGIRLGYFINYLVITKRPAEIIVPAEITQRNGSS